MISEATRSKVDPKMIHGPQRTYLNDDPNSSAETSQGPCDEDQQCEPNNSEDDFLGHDESGKILQSMRDSQDRKNVMWAAPCGQVGRSVSSSICALLAAEEV